MKISFGNSTIKQDISSRKENKMKPTFQVTDFKSLNPKRKNHIFDYFNYQPKDLNS